ncbi:MAG TPA: long-chain fatty acid--CoA ligase [Chitinophagales bacterium]|nr:long-chain fatty acid--CoA ligase [Chitinophagales bacterium]
MSYTRIFDIIENQLSVCPLDKCLSRREDKKTWKSYSTQEFIATANKLSQGLLQLGLQKGDTIAIISTTNRPEWHFTDLACMQIGVVDIPVYPTISSKEYEFIFNHAEVKYVFVSDKLMYRKISQIIPNIPSLKGVYSFDEVENVKHWKQLLADNDELSKKVADIRQSIQPNDLATIIYTSGTTGVPKGVMLSHNNIVSNVKDCLIAIPLQKKEIVLSFLPLSHVFERTINYVYFAGCVSVYFADGLETISEHLQDIRPHYFTTVPRLLERVYEKIIKKGQSLTGLKRQLFFWSLKQAQENELGKPRSFSENSNLIVANKFVFNKWRDALGGRIKAIICGSAPLQPRLATIFTNAGIPVLEGYGLTECSPVVSVVPFRPKDFRAGCVGKLLPSVQVKIEGDGEILIKAPNVMLGYYKNEEETAKVFDKDGWLLTGDVGEFTADGFLKITDRKKELFKTSGGKYVAPAPIENKLKESEYIDQIALEGDGEKYISALIIPNFENLKEWCAKHDITTISNGELIHNQEVKQLFKDIITEFNVNFGKVEQIKQFELLADEWTVENGLLTATMKLKRKVIKEKYKDLIETFYNKIS